MQQVEQQLKLIITEGLHFLNEHEPDFAFIFHHSWTVPAQTKDGTISLRPQNVTWRFHDCLGC